MDLPRLTIKRQKMVAAMAAEYGEPLDDLNWVSEARARESEGWRARLLASLAAHLAIDFKETKPHLGPLSPGCRICGDGAWSCLFISGKCNCRCFYCPTRQDEIGIPTTNQIPFAKAGDYADYVRYFHFRGVSISGGEPLLDLDRTVRHIKAVRRKMGDDVHLWLYTNGTLLSVPRLHQLRDAGLNEIRLDIGAADYRLDKAAMAVGIIPCVTIEIPAIPEDHQRLEALLPVMSQMGINHLNLHQLRLTPHNLGQLTRRPYTYLHGEKVTVLESELTALALIQTACIKKIPLPINYCSFLYKHRYQRAAARRRNARLVLKGHETITENGYIRTLALRGTPECIARQAARLDGVADRGLWQINSARDRLTFHPTLWSLIEDDAGDLLIGYAEAGLRAHISYRFFFREIQVNPDKRLYVERWPVFKEISLQTDQRLKLRACLASPAEALAAASMPADLGPIADYEFIEPGLQDYF
jgi:pyruvate formate-lyase activating enzyme-like uncharacterized protein